MTGPAASAPVHADESFPAPGNGAGPFSRFVDRQRYSGEQP